MEQFQRKMLEILKELRDECGATAARAEFEAEGTRVNELVMLSEVAHRADVGLILKIGGCEAVSDLENARVFGATTIVAPMVESPFAMSKYKGAAQKVFGDEAHRICWAVNIETKTAHENLEGIIAAGAGFFDCVTIGRVDLAASMGLTRDEINSQEVFEATRDIASRAKDAGMHVSLGGGISFDAIPAIRNLKGAIDRFETRKVSFNYTDDEKLLKRGLFLSMEFETLYLEGKCAYYDRLANEDRARLKMMHARVNQARQELGLA